MTTLLVHDAPSTHPTWQIERRFVTVRGVRRPVRLVRFETGWLASVDTDDGPTLGADRSPFLAARRALEPLGIGLVEAMTVVGRVGGR
ncbi:MAG: hypothetical protein M3Y29_05065 [Chloroflexota bacterium]|nr:hypothetical protein [Chloroflexota bacterium]